MQKAKYDLYLKHNSHPNIIIQVVGINTLKMRDDLFQKEQFIPYLSDTIIKNATLKYDGLDFFDYNLPLLRYKTNSHLLADSFVSLIEFGNLFKDKYKYKGYEAYDKVWDTSFDVFKKSYPNGRKYKINKESLKLFDNYLREEKQKGTFLVIVFSPTYIESQKYVNNRTELIDTYKKFSKKYDIPFFDYSSNALTTDKINFYNSQHLNKKGAELFSIILCADLNKILNKQK
ncbi:hypothetical protein [Algibacter sp. L1A34]|uniref:hypothetical protein n=1 Tax=Algibacter sp. L1A34 TaxID=2686365 RepID=UPI00131C08EA|nr:hypothetical protein [Algibacter sp. L1A34]